MKIRCPTHIGQQYSIAYGLEDYLPQDKVQYMV
jgi:hypothetical protein